jgi:hypothetical protein
MREKREGEIGLDSIRIAEVSWKICVIAPLKCKGNVPVSAETAFTVNTAYVCSILNYLKKCTKIYHETFTIRIESSR